jgi:1-acyl-sn-glycerol-3-phosphate acyltransferase
MNRFAYLATGQVIAFMEAISRVHVNIHGRVNIPEGSLIFVVNHFTRIETLLLPYHVYQLTQVPVWSLADPNLFNGAFGSLLETVGALSTSDPHRDRLIVKSLLTGEANWIIFPEGCMVKDKAFVEHARYAISCAGGRRPPHTGAATLALRTEFYRRRLRELVSGHPDEAERLRMMFGIDDMGPVLEGTTRIVPVNITYYPLRARENAISRLASRFIGAMPAQLHEELLTEGAMHPHRAGHVFTQTDRLRRPAAVAPGHASGGVQGHAEIHGCHLRTDHSQPRSPLRHPPEGDAVQEDRPR